MDGFLQNGVVPKLHIGWAPARLPAAASRTSMSLADRVNLGRPVGGARTHYRKRDSTMPTILERRKAEQLACKKDDARASARPSIFTAEFIETQGFEAIAALLDACYYDLVDMEKRLATR